MTLSRSPTWSGSALALFLLGCSHGASVDAVDASAPGPFTRAGDAWVAALPDPSVKIRLPVDAAGPTSIEDARTPSFGVSVRLLGARSGAAQVEGSSLVFRDTLGPGTRVTLHVDRDGTEDFVHLPERPAEPTLAWEVTLGAGVAGLRLLADTLELLDREGVPRLRVAPPWVRDAAGERHAATLSVEACAVDRSAAAPWGRPPIDPGARTCTLRVRWPAALSYPVLVDPAWTTTGSMITGRRSMATAVLASGKVLLIGGQFATSGTFLTTAELFDPATGTFASAGVMAVSRANPAAVTLGSGKVLVTGGVLDGGTGNVTANAELYDPASGWAPTGPMIAARGRHTATLLPSGAVLVAGSMGDGDSKDSKSTAEIYTPGTGTFAATGSMADARGRHSATLLPSGKVVVIGGTYLGATYEYLSTAEIYDPGTGTWAPTGSLPAKRISHVAALLATGKVLIANGGQAGTVYSDAHLFDPATGTFSAAFGTLSPRSEPAGALLPDGRLVVSGSVNGSFTTGSPVDIYLPSTGTWSASTPTAVRRYAHAAVAISGSRILVAGGTDGPSHPAAAEIFATMANGEACSGPGECTSTFCADGVCCDSACTATCASCTAALKTSGGNGTCGPSKVALADAGCATSSTSTCGLDGTCDGTGVCRKWVSGTTCVASSCTATTQTNASLCDGAGACVAKGTTACATGYGCGGIVCATSCATDGNCAPGYWCSGTTCVLKLVDGTTCGAGNQCVSGVCADSVCCATACDASCDACTKSLKGSGVDGVCDHIPAGTAGRGLCTGSSYCDTGACKGKKANGEAAGNGFECSSGIVADGVCCATSCAGTCAACDTATNKGTCVAVKGAPKHGTCPPTGSDPCSASSCDGADLTSCKQFAGAEVVCRPRSCAAGSETAEAKCEGSGACPAPKTRPCDPLVCDGDQCRTTCRSDADCASPNKCDTITHSCIKGASCDGDHTVTSATGAKKDCYPLKCSGADCLPGCNSTADCVTGFACDTATKSCSAVEAPAPVADSGGCAVGAASRAPTAGLATALLALVGLGRRSRVRRRG